MPIGVITGMASEARLLRGLGVDAIATGGNPRATRDAIANLIGRGADRLVSFGIAGALDPDLQPGDLVLGAAVHMPEGERLPVDQKWLVHLATHLPGARVADIAGSSQIVATAEQKALLHRDTGAVAVDQESHWIAEAVRPTRIAFVVIRAIADRAGDSLPPAVLAGLDAEGRPQPRAVMAALLRNPKQIGGLIRVALQTRKALRTLLRSRTALAL